MTTAKRRTLIAAPIVAALMVGVAACAATPSTSTAGSGAGDKPPRPTSSASTDEGKCQDYGRAALDADAGGRGGRVMPALRLTLVQGQVRLLVYADEASAVTCWLSGDQVYASAGRNATAINDETYPAGQLSYSSEDSGHGWGGAAFGRVPAGTTKVTISFPTGAEQIATIDGEWYGYLAPDSTVLAEAAKVTATTPSGPLSRPVQHG